MYRLLDQHSCIACQWLPLCRQCTHLLTPSKSTELLVGLWEKHPHKEKCLAHCVLCCYEEDKSSSLVFALLKQLLCRPEGIASCRCTCASLKHVEMASQRCMSFAVTMLSTAHVYTQLRVTSAFLAKHGQLHSRHHLTLSTCVSHGQVTI